MTGTVFVLYLAAMELTFCIVCTPIYIYMYTQTFWLFGPFGQLWCKFVSAWSVLNGNANWFAISLLSATRCIGFTRKSFWVRFCSKTRNVALLFTLPWIWSLLFNLPLLIDPSFEYGYDCQLGICDIVPTGQTPVWPVFPKTNIKVHLNQTEWTLRKETQTEYSFQEFTFNVSFFAPSLLMILSSYLVIWYRLRLSFSYERKTKR